jgi:uncharacterized protein
MLGEAVDSVCIGQRGVEGDRAFAAGSAKRMAALFGFAARTAGGRVEIVFPDGRCFDARDEALDAAMSEVLGVPVALQGAGPVQHVDDSPVHLLTTSSIAWLRVRLPDAKIDERRFRPNVVLEAPGTGPIEQGWIGRTLALGDARLRITHPTERCVMTTLAQADLPADPRVLKRLGQDAGACFGVYAEVVQPGRVAVGDPAS